MVKAANHSSSLIISCASSDQRFVSFIPKHLWRGVGGRSWFRLVGSSLLLPRRWLRSDGRWSCGQEQQAPSAAPWVT